MLNAILETNHLDFLFLYIKYDISFFNLHHSLLVVLNIEFIFAFFFYCRYADALRFVAPRMIQVLSMISHWLPYLNSSINPIIYNFMSGE